MPVTPADLQNKQFATTRLRPGYDEEEVDAFLDEVQAELERLLAENQELRAKLAQCLRGGTSAVPIPSAPPGPPEAGSVVPEPAPRAEHGPEPVRIGGPAAGEEMGTAARVLVLAQQTADQAIADARREAEETLGRARHEADGILANARRQAEQITSDARARAESLERDAQQRHREALGSLTVQREELELRVHDLRAFEREYRSRLRAYLEGTLRDLQATGSSTFPALTAPPHQPPLPDRQFGTNGRPAAQPAGTSAPLQHQPHE